jgi:hypothetical protein
MTHLSQAACLVLCCLAAAGPARAGGPPGDPEVQRRLSAAQVPLERVAEGLRAKVADLIDHAPLYSKGPVESFPCQPAVYHWLLDHPHWGFKAWQALGATAATVERQPDGSFVGTDPQGSHLRWQTVLSEPGRRIWYVEGVGRAAPVLPGLTIKAVVLLRYQDVVGLDGRHGVRHRAELFAHYEGKTATVLARLSGMTVDGTAAKIVEQMELFFSGMAWYATEHPAWVRKVLQPKPEERAQVEELYRVLAAGTTP